MSYIVPNISLGYSWGLNQINVMHGGRTIEALFYVVFKFQVNKYIL